MAPEAIVFQFAKIVLGQLGSAVVQEVKLVLGVEDELDRIRSNLTAIQAVLQDAEKKQTTSEFVKNWVQKLQDVMYDIDDLLDGIATQVTIQDKNKGEWSKQVRKFFSRHNSLVLRRQWAHQIKNLSKKLELIAFERINLGLSNEHVDLYPSDLASRETTAKVNKLVLGRDEDKEAIINSILNCGDCGSLSVLPIMGFGGIGKTTLAQLVYNDSRIDDNFGPKLWVYVSEKFNVKKVLKQVISMATGENILQLTMEQLSLEQLRMKTIVALKDRRYFLVLDDLWNEDSEEWLKLKELLDVGAKGSTVIVTTRNLKVASIVQTVEEYKLPELSHEICLQIFKKLAFKDGEKIKPALLNLANEIVEKSRRLPLLVTTLGNLLCGETDDKEWCRVIQKLEQGHEDILKILKLSYDQLPSYFKLCFRISSIYSQGGEIIPLFHLIPLWMALGLLPFDEQGEALGRKCIRELVSKSLFMRDEVLFYDDMLDLLHMHDCVYDLAKSVTGEELAIINCSTKEVSEKARYIRLEGDGFLGNIYHERLLNQAKKARLLSIETTDHSISKAFLQTIFSKLTFLRVLDLSYCQLEKIPRTIGYMMHLRYLNLGGNMRIKQLPNSICNLINLQTLILLDCTNLQDLPGNIGRLENLKVLALTTQQEFLPKDIGNIKGLRVFVLSGCLKLAFLPISTKQLENLDILMIGGCEELDLTHRSWSVEGLKSLRMLMIENVPKFQKLPMGVTGFSLPSLQDLIVSECEGLVELTDWIQYLTCLKTLTIANCPNLVGMPHTLCLLNKLEKLAIRECPTLIEKCKGEDRHLISNIPHIQLDGEMITNGVIQSS